MNQPQPRKPAPISARHRQPSREVGNPQPGFFKLRLVKGGPYLPARIMCQDGLWWAVIAGVARAKHADPAYAPDLYRIWHGGDFITGAEYATAMKVLQSPSTPRLPANRKIDLTKLPSLF